MNRSPLPIPNLFGSADDAGETAWVGQAISAAMLVLLLLGSFGALSARANRPDPEISDETLKLAGVAAPQTMQAEE